MTRVLSVGQVLRLHEMVMAQAQASAAVRDLAALESAVAQPRMTFSGEDLYPTVSSKAAALGF